MFAFNVVLLNLYIKGVWSELSSHIALHGWCTSACSSSIRISCLLSPDLTFAFYEGFSGGVTFRFFLTTYLATAAPLSLVILSHLEYLALKSPTNIILSPFPHVFSLASPSPWLPMFAVLCVWRQHTRNDGPFVYLHLELLCQIFVICGTDL